MIVRGTCLAAASLALLSWNGHQGGRAPSVRPAGVPVGDFEAPPPPPAYVPYLYIDLPKAAGDEGAHDQEKWKPICWQSKAMTLDELRRQVLIHKTIMRGPTEVLGGSPDPRLPSLTGLDVVFNIAPSVPAAARTALRTVEDYIESQFRDPMRIWINISFQAMGSGVLGVTSSNFRSIQYTNVPSNMVTDMDSDDTLQAYLPTTSTIPVRYNQTATVTNENQIFFTFANWRATGGTINSSNPDAAMAFNSQFNWDYDPSNGIAVGRYSFVDTIIHEVGHAMGFTSGVDNRPTDMEALDMFRFQRTDGTGNYNPDDLAAFTTTPRLQDLGLPNDDHNTDLISVEYRMSDGDPYQASHWREQVANIGIMDPAIAVRQTFYPNYYSAADVAGFDAIGYDR